jgi:hypothetical protein
MIETERNDKTKLSLVLKLCVLDICGYEEKYIKFKADYLLAIQQKYEPVLCKNFDVTSSSAYLPAVDSLSRDYYFR